MNTIKSYFCNFSLIFTVALFALTGCDKDQVFLDKGQDAIFTDNIIRYNVSSLQKFATKSEADNSTEFLDYKLSENENMPFMYLSNTKTMNSNPNFDSEYSNKTVYTKSTPIASNIYLNQKYGNFGVSCFIYNNDRDSLLIDNKKISYNAQKSVWGEYPYYYWYIKPNNKHVFFAYSPYVDYVNKSGNTLSDYLEVSSENRNMTFGYEVPQDPLDQLDILYAKGLSKDSDGYVYNSKGMPYVDLKFKHALTGVRIQTALGTDEYVLERLELCNVKNSGTFNVNTQKWTLNDSRSNYLSESVYVQTTDNNGNPISMPIFDGDSTLFLLPQDLDSVTLKITFSCNDTVIAGINYKDVGTYEFDNLGEYWSAGMINTYLISLGFDHQTEWKIETSDFNDGEQYIDYSATDIEFKVNSFVTVTNSSGKKEKKHVDWDMTFSTDGERFVDTCDWISVSIDPITDYVDAVNISVSAQTPISLPSTRDDYLAIQPVKGSPSKPWDLSLKSQNNIDSRNTANCYIVNAPGTYKIPLVYGNSIINNYPNGDSYNNGSTSASFPNYLGNPIDYPWIKDDGKIGGACLVWEDVPGLISNLGLLDEIPDYEVGAQGEGRWSPYFDNPDADDYLTFTIDKSVIKQGNAVVGVKDTDGKIMWSWHIWVTDYPNSDNDNQEVTDRDVPFTYNSTTYNMAAINLGWVYIGQTLYPEREVNIKLEQKGNPENFQVLKLIQREHYVPNRGYGLAYQHGRKDPFPFWFACQTRRYYTDVNDAVGSVADISHSNGNSMSYAQMHQNPFIFNASIPSGSHFWTVNNNTEYRTKKTVFDPCPYGYCVPNKEALDFVVKYNSENSSSDVNNFDGQWWGRFFYNNGKTGYIWLPSVGHRNNPDGLTQAEEFRHDQGEGTDAAYHSSTVTNGTNDYIVNFFGWKGFSAGDQPGEVTLGSRYSGESIRMMVDTQVQ